jgi:SAM-dependent methyltransferase
MPSFEGTADVRGVDTATGERARAEPAGFPDEAFAAIADVDQDYFWFKGRNELITWALARYFPGCSRLLEVGCGTGVVLEAIRASAPELDLVGSDLSPEALRIVRRRVPDAGVLELDAADLSFSAEFDVVCAFDVLEHLDDDADALVRMASAVRPGGGVLVNVPQYAWLWSAADEYGGHRRRYTGSDIESKVRSAGLRVVRSFAWMGLLLPVLALSRIRDRPGKPFDPVRELSVPGWLNRAFEAVLSVERRGIEHGVAPPFGASRFVVGAKP